MKILSVIVSTRYGVVELSSFGILERWYNKTIKEVNTWRLRVVFLLRIRVYNNEDKIKVF